MGKRVINAPKRIVGKIVLVVFAFVLLQGGVENVQMSSGKETSEGKSYVRGMVSIWAEDIEDVLYRQFIPAYALWKEKKQGKYGVLQGPIGDLLPVYEYMLSGLGKKQETTIVLVENEEPSENKLELLEAENLLVRQNQKQVPDTIIESVPMVPDENIQAPMITSAFIPHTRQTQVDLLALTKYEVLLQQFYTVDANTSPSSERLNVDKFMEKDMKIAKETKGPQILIFHSHASEGFADSEAGNDGTTIVGTGERLAEILQETYGYRVLHHLGKYDGTRDDAYAKALPEIRQLLKDNPSIEVVIDLHRDQMPEGTKLVMDLDGKPTARFMFFNGLSRTRKTGNISYLKNDNLDDNLAFSFQMQMKAMEYYPGLTRKIYLKGYRYNMHLMPKYLLVELGAQNNTVEEAWNACEPLAHILDLVLSGDKASDG